MGEKINGFVGSAMDLAKRDISRMQNTESLAKNCFKSLMDLLSPKYALSSKPSLEDEEKESTTLFENKLANKIDAHLSEVLYKILKDEKKSNEEIRLFFNVFLDEAEEEIDFLEFFMDDDSVSKLSNNYSEWKIKVCKIVIDRIKYFLQNNKEIR